MLLRYKLFLIFLNLALLPLDWMIIQAKPETLRVAHTAIAIVFHLFVVGVATIRVKRRNRARLREQWQRTRKR
jgi:hypothetical protein